MDYIIGAGAVNFAGVYKVMISIGVCTLVTAFAQWIMNICNNKMTYQIVRDIRNEAFQKIEILPLKYIDTHPHGELVSRVIADVDQFADGLLMGFTQLFTGAATILGTFCFQYVVSECKDYFCGCIDYAGVIFCGKLYRKAYLCHVQAAVSTTRGEQAGLIDEMIGNQKVVADIGQKRRSDRTFSRNQPALAEIFSSGNLLFVHYESCHAVCKQSGIYGCRDYRGIFSIRGRIKRWTVDQLFKLCKPVYKTVQ